MILGELGQSIVSPVQAKASRAKIARAKNGPPVASWHRRQWQTRTFAGSAVAVHRTWPHRHPPA